MHIPEKPHPRSLLSVLIGDVIDIFYFLAPLVISYHIGWFVCHRFTKSMGFLFRILSFLILGYLNHISWSLKIIVVPGNTFGTRYCGVQRLIAILCLSMVGTGNARG